jgi:SHS2 domain-containing protein
MKHYKLLGHTADMGITVWGDNLKGLFQHAAIAMYDLVADINTIRPVISFPVDIKAFDADELLRNWLSELLYYFHAKNILLSGFSIEVLSDTGIISMVSGEKTDSSRHVLKREIKAVTFHNLHIMQTESGFQTDIIFDT